uniref:Uncharacterized protein n=1 Tax=Strombidium inclinatum TaxID=197538 RepID=A0A7S3IF39_9SPIT
MSLEELAHGHDLFLTVARALHLYTVDTHLDLFRDWDKAISFFVAVGVHAPCFVADDVTILAENLIAVRALLASVNQHLAFEAAELLFELAPFLRLKDLAQVKDVLV